MYCTTRSRLCNIYLLNCFVVLQEPGQQYYILPHDFNFATVEYTKGGWDEVTIFEKLEEIMGVDYYKVVNHTIQEEQVV